MKECRSLEIHGFHSELFVGGHFIIINIQKAREDIFMGVIGDS
jgi:hypothetical protein